MKNVRSRIRNVCILSGVALVGFGASVAAESYFGGAQLEAGESSSGAKIILIQGHKGNREAGAGDQRGGASAEGGGGRGGASGGRPGRDGGTKVSPPTDNRVQRDGGGAGGNAGRSGDRRRDGNAPERDTKKARAGEDRRRSGGNSDAVKHVQEGKKRRSIDRGGRDHADRGSRWSGFGGRGRRYHRKGRVGFYFWAPWIGDYVYYNDFDSCYAASYNRCRSADYSAAYCKHYVNDLCAW